MRFVRKALATLRSRRAPESGDDLKPFSVSTSVHWLWSGVDGGLTGLFSFCYISSLVYEKKESHECHMSDICIFSALSQIRLWMNAKIQFGVRVRLAANSLLQIRHLILSSPNRIHPCSQRANGRPVASCLLEFYPFPYHPIVYLGKVPPTKSYHRFVSFVN